MFRGLTSTWAREVPGYFFFFGGYSGSLVLLTPKDKQYNNLSKSVVNISTWYIYISWCVQVCGGWLWLEGWLAAASGQLYFLQMLSSLECRYSRELCRDHCNLFSLQVNGQLSGSLWVTMYDIIKNEGNVC